MLIAQIHVHVKPESVEDFTQATIENARASIQEPGIARFDVVQQQDDALASCWWKSTAHPMP